MGWVRAGSVLMGLGVALGAYGAHGMRQSFPVEAQQSYHTAVLYQLIHGLALLAVGCLTILKPTKTLLKVSGWAFVLGIGLFSGSLYLLSLTGMKRLGIVTPFGGLALLLGWLCLACAATP